MNNSKLEMNYERIFFLLKLNACYLKKLDHKKKKVKKKD